MYYTLLITHWFQYQHTWREFGDLNVSKDIKLEVFCKQFELNRLYRQNLDPFLKTSVEQIVSFKTLQEIDSMYTDFVECEKP